MDKKLNEIHENLISMKLTISINYINSINSGLTQQLEHKRTL